MIYVFRNGDAHILAKDIDLDRYGFIAFEKEKWRHVRTMSETVEALSGLVDNPTKILATVQEFGHFTVSPQMYRFAQRIR